MKHPSQLRLAMAQINSVVGDIEGNAQKILASIAQARESGADIVTFPELALTGYPPEDLLLKPHFIDANLAALEKVVRGTEDITVVVGFVDRKDDIFNAAAIAQNGKLVTTYHKIYLPNYGVFDEFRYFQPGKECPVLEMDGATIGVSICEDIWYPDGPVFEQALSGGAEVIINISSSPYHAGKRHWRERMLATRASDNTVIVAYNNLVGGQDELVFDGDSLVFNENGEIIARGKQFEEDLVVVDLDIESVFRKRLHDPRRRQQRENPGQTGEYLVFKSKILKKEHKEHAAEISGQTGQTGDLLPEEGEIYKALVVGTRDYVLKNGFKKVVLGLSGGIDSALTACIAVDALGKENVIGVMMPSEFSSKGSVEDSEQLGKNLGIKLLTIPISDVLHAYTTALKSGFEGAKPDVTEENLQARIRGNYLMALSNKFGWLVLSTGNKSEISTGYCTLYGDMAGGFAVLKDVMKTTVYKLSEYCGRIPRPIIDKPPSAELRPNQFDTDSLPAYDVLDPILKAYVEEDRSLAEIIDMGFDEQLVRRVIRLVDMSEYKRRQAAPGVKITPRAFGRDRRMPITNRFK